MFETILNSLLRSVLIGALVLSAACKKPEDDVRSIKRQGTSNAKADKSGVDKRPATKPAVDDPKNAIPVETAPVPEIPVPVDVTMPVEGKMPVDETMPVVAEPLKGIIAAGTCSEVGRESIGYWNEGKFIALGNTIEHGKPFDMRIEGQTLYVATDKGYWKDKVWNSLALVGKAGYLYGQTQVGNKIASWGTSGYFIDKEFIALSSLIPNEEPVTKRPLLPAVILDGIAVGEDLYLLATQNSDAYLIKNKSIVKKLQSHVMTMGIKGGFFKLGSRISISAIGVADLTNAKLGYFTSAFRMVGDINTGNPPELWNMAIADTTPLLGMVGISSDTFGPSGLAIGKINGKMVFINWKTAPVPAGKIANEGMVATELKGKEGYEITEAGGDFHTDAKRVPYHYFLGRNSLKQTVAGYFKGDEMVELGCAASAKPRVVGIQAVKP